MVYFVYVFDNGGFYLAVQKVSSACHKRCYKVLWGFSGSLGALTIPAGHSRLVLRGLCFVVCIGFRGL